jgi:eukaryotic-like serine/threonine-protein kinase
MRASGTAVLGRRYALEEKIGAGGYSEVWRGTDTVLTRQVAVKLLHLGYAQEAEVLARFRAEAQHAGALSHENIARVYDYREPDPPQPPFLIMEFVDGPSLAAVLANGPLDPTRTMDIVAQTAAGLHAAHLAGLVHRDIKPANLLLSPRGIVKITDFGIAHAAGRAPMTDTNQLVGTPGYLAPERAMGAQATAASDLYSLGIVAYECLAGAPPFTGVALAVALAHHERPLPPLPGHVPAEVAALVLQLTAKDPAARPHSAGDVAARAGALAARLRTGVREPAGVRSGDPAAVAGQAMRYPVALPEEVTELPTQRLAAQGPTRRTARRPVGALWRRRTGRAALAAAAGLLVVVAALLIGSVTEAGHASHAGAVPSATPSGPARAGPARARTVDVRRATLVGQPARTAARLLRQQGLAVRIRWRHSDAQAPGTVLSVRPAGPRPVGSLVTLTAALRPGQPGRGPPGHGPPVHGPHGHAEQGDGQRGGDGQQGGDGQRAGDGQLGGHGHQGTGTGHRRGHPSGNLSVV